jgi:C4-dicarboxylate-specific signal transduction histidine kinase
MIDRFSLRWRVPAIIALILIGAVVTLAALAYGAARRSAIQVATDRLTHAANTVAQTTSVGLDALKQRTMDIANHPLIVRAVRNPGTPLSPEAQAILRRVRTDTLLTVKVAVLDTLGRPIEGVAPEMIREEPLGAFTPVDTPTVSPFHIVNGLLEWVIAVPVRDSGRVIGQLVQWRQVPRVTQSLNLIGDLIGNSAVLVIGNADGTSQVELSDTLQGPIVRDSSLIRKARAEMTSVSAAIPGTPWAWTLDYPNATILRPLGFLSWQSAFVVVGVFALALMAGVLLSKDMTHALADLTKTAEFIAAGDLKRRPAETTRQDEIGRLARSFTAMAGRVSDARDELEGRISERTADLESAVKQLRETQDELVRKERLATIGQLASSVGHELRNPLGVMSNSVYLLERTIDTHSPKTEQYLRLLRTQIKLSERIVSDLLDSARNPAPQRKLVDVHSFIAEQVERVPMPPHVNLQVAVDDKLPPMHVDPDQIGQILVNLLTNGAQSIGQNHGTLSVRARNGDGRIHIDVRDTGPGVPVELADKIFEPLFTTKARGIGLGLSVSRSLAAANDGALSVANHPQGGAVFTLDLPSGHAG